MIGLNALKDLSNVSEMSAALIPRSRGPSIDININVQNENIPRGFTTIDMDPGLSFDESDDD